MAPSTPKLRQLDMPRNFFGGNNCVVEYGNFPSNFMLGVSTPGNDIQFRRQMRSRVGEPITVAGNPPLEFASASFEADNEIHRLPDFPLFLLRIFLFDLFSIGILPLTEVIIFVIFVTCLLRLGGHPIASAAIALTLVELNLVLFSVAIKKSLVGSEWGTDHSRYLLVLAPLCLLLRAGLLLHLVQEASGILRRNYSLQFHPAADGMSHRPGDNR